MYQVGAACYSTPSAAAHAAASNLAGSVVQHGGLSYAVAVGAVDDSSITYQFRAIDGSTVFDFVSPWTPQPCGLLDFSDGLALGWLLVGIWASTYAVMFLTRVFAGSDRGDENGNS